jgi:hypothetical protein
VTPARILPFRTTPPDTGELADPRCRFATADRVGPAFTRVRGGLRSNCQRPTALVRTARTPTPLDLRGLRFHRRRRGRRPDDAVQVRGEPPRDRVLWKENDGAIVRAASEESTCGGCSPADKYRRPAESMVSIPLRSCEGRSSDGEDPSAVGAARLHARAARSFGCTIAVQCLVAQLRACPPSATNEARTMSEALSPFFISLRLPRPRHRGHDDECQAPMSNGPDQDLPDSAVRRYAPNRSCSACGTSGSARDPLIFGQLLLPKHRGCGLGR